MIALINFNKPMFLKKEEVKELNLKIKEPQSQWGLQGTVFSIFGYNAKWRDECECIISDDIKKYFSTNSKGEKEEVTSYYLFDRIPNIEDYIEVEQNHQLVELNDFALKCQYSYSIERCISTQEPSVSNISHILNEIEEKTQSLLKLSENMKSYYNEKVNVHMGGGLITTYNELMLKENTCTDELQQELNCGWRILAVCVQPNQRRPDYILARYNPNLDVIDCKDAKR